MASKTIHTTALLAGLFGLCVMGNIAAAQAQVPVPSASTASKAVATAGAIGASPGWQKLSPEQQLALKPIQADWPHLDANRKKKWLAVAQRYQTMSPTDQNRMHTRMNEWAKLTPAQRSVARDNYSAVLSSPSSASADPAAKGNLNEQWAKYQALTPEKKASLTEQANKADTIKTKPLARP